MALLSRYYPYEYVEDVFSIDYDRLYEKGIRGLIFDIDNTLVPHGADSTKEIDDLFVRIHKTGLRTLLLSNNSESRVKRFMANIDTLYIYDANKPEVDAFKQAVIMLGVKDDEAVVIGDQVFTDVYGANRCGLASILVKYIGYYKTEKKGIRRNIERVILYLYEHSKKNQHRLNL